MTWEKIATTFNRQQTTGERIISQLKTVYDMTKRLAKKSLSNDKVSKKLQAGTKVLMIY